MQLNSGREYEGLARGPLGRDRRLVDCTRRLDPHGVEFARAIELTLAFVRYVVGVSLAAGVFVTWIVDGLGEALRPRRFASALNWKRLLIVAAAVVGLMWLPWQAVSWRRRRCRRRSFSRCSRQSNSR